MHRSIMILLILYTIIFPLDSFAQQILTRDKQREKPNIALITFEHCFVTEQDTDQSPLNRGIEITTQFFGGYLAGATAGRAYRCRTASRRGTVGG